MNDVVPRLTYIQLSGRLPHWHDEVR